MVSGHGHAGYCLGCSILVGMDVFFVGDCGYDQSEARYGMCCLRELVVVSRACLPFVPSASSMFTSSQAPQDRRQRFLLCHSRLLWAERIVGLLGYYITLLPKTVYHFPSRCDSCLQCNAKKAVSVVGELRASCHAVWGSSNVVKASNLGSVRVFSGLAHLFRRRTWDLYKALQAKLQEVHCATHSTLQSSSMSQPSLANFIIKRPWLRRWMQPLSAWYFDNAGYRKLGLRYDHYYVLNGSISWRRSTCVFQC